MSEVEIPVEIDPIIPCVHIFKGEDFVFKFVKIHEGNQGVHDITIDFSDKFLELRKQFAEQHGHAEITEEVKTAFVSYVVEAATEEADGYRLRIL